VKLLCIILPPSCQSTQAGLRLSTDPELLPAGSRFRLARYEDAISRWEQSATEDAEDEARIEATPTIDSQ
jgi:hypothetical protein